MENTAVNILLIKSYKLRFFEVVFFYTVSSEMQNSILAMQQYIKTAQEPVKEKII